MSAAAPTEGEGARGEEARPRRARPPNRERRDLTARPREDGVRRTERRTEPSGRAQPEQPGHPEQPESEQPEQPQRRRPAEAPPDKSKLSAAKLARLAVEQVVDLIGRDPEVVTSIERTDEGWRVGIEVIESHRIPDSADILAIYQADLDTDGDLMSYRRIRRYPRGRGQED